MFSSPPLDRQGAKRIERCGRPEASAQDVAYEALVAPAIGFPYSGEKAATAASSSVDATDLAQLKGQVRGLQSQLDAAKSSGNLKSKGSDYGPSKGKDKDDKSRSEPYGKDKGGKGTKGDKLKGGKKPTSTDAPRKELTELYHSKMMQICRNSHQVNQRISELFREADRADDEEGGSQHNYALKSVTRDCCRNCLSLGRCDKTHETLKCTKKWSLYCETCAKKDPPVHRIARKSDCDHK